MVNFNASTPQLKVVKSVFDAFSSVNISKVESLLSKNFQYEAFNGVTDSFGLVKMNNEELAKAAQRLMPGMTKLDFTYHEVIEAPGKVVVHFSPASSTASGATLTYDTLIIISLGEEDGELKVLSIKDFPDPQKRSAYIAEATKIAAEKGSAS